MVTESGWDVDKAGMCLGVSECFLVAFGMCLGEDCLCLSGDWGCLGSV